MHEVLVNRLGGLSLPRKSVVRLTDRPDMTLDVYRGRKTTMQCNINCFSLFFISEKMRLDISCESSAPQRIHMKHQALFSPKHIKVKQQKKNSVVCCNMLGSLRVS